MKDGKGGETDQCEKNQERSRLGDRIETRNPEFCFGYMKLGMQTEV